MGFCEMVYHETRNFPEGEKEGLGRELRSSSMLLLKTITRESIKPQREFLKSLDHTVEMQLDVLLLLKLAFRMGFIAQNVYATMEEDLKGLEHIVNEMKNMHGIPLPAESIHGKMVESKSVKPEPVKPVPEKIEKVESKDPKPSPNRSRRSRSSKPKSAIQPGSSLPKKEPEVKLPVPHNPEPKKETEKPEPPPKPQVNLRIEEFKGTPLYDDEQDTKPEPKPENKSETHPEVHSNGDKPSETDAEKTHKKRKGRWSLKRSSGKK